MSYTVTINPNGACRVHREGDPPNIYTAHRNPELRAWMEAKGYWSVHQIPVVQDLRTDACEVCGKLGVEVHHWAPKEWFGEEEAERWPKAELCVPCHRVWHWAAEKAAAALTARILRGKGMALLAQKIEDALKETE